MRTSRHIGAVGAVVALALAGCAGNSATRTSTAPGKGSTAPGRGPFAWLASGRVPASWPPPGTLAGGALPRPPGWRATRGDRGSVSFVRLHAGAIVGYLNATPQSGAETLTNWRRFRIAHNAQEGDRDVHPLAGVTRRHVGAARVSCVIDDYGTSVSSYRELACLVAGPRPAAVVVGAAPPSAWKHQQPVIERAIAGFVAS